MGRQRVLERLERSPAVLTPSCPLLEDLWGELKKRKYNARPKTLDDLYLVCAKSKENLFSVNSNSLKCNRNT